MIRARGSERGNDAVPNTDQPAQQETGRPSSDRPRRPWFRRPTTWVGLGVVVVAGGYCAAALALGGQAPRGTTVLGADVGGQDRAAVESTLSGRAQQLSTTPVALQVTGAGASATDEVVPGEAGLAVDAAATAERLTGPAWAPADLWRHLTGGTTQAPEVDVDTAALRTALQPLADSVAVAPVEGAVTFDVREDGTVEPPSPPRRTGAPSTSTPPPAPSAAGG